MKKIFFLLVMIIVLTSMSFANENIDVLINPELSLYFDSLSYNFYDAQGNDVYPITYDNSTYLPVRALSSLFNNGITWQEDIKTIILGQGEIDTQSARMEGHISKKAYREQAIKSDEITIMFNGEKQIFTDANGEVVYPILFKGTTYLPVRALANLFDTSINWVDESKSIQIYSIGLVDETNDTIEEYSKTNNGFANEAEDDALAFKGQVFKIRNLSGTLYYKYINTYAGQKAQEIINGTSDSIRSAFNVSEKIKDDEIFYVAIFEVDTSEYVSILGDQILFVDLMPAMRTKILGEIDEKMYSKEIDSTNTYNGGLFLADKQFYKIGDIVKLYYVYPINKEFEPMSVSYEIADFIDNKYKTFSHSFVLEKIEQ